MKVGGYQIIDLENRNLEPDVGVVFNGIYELLEGTRKPILLSGLQFNGFELHDIFCDFVPIDGVYVSTVTVGGQTASLTVTAEDVVTLSVDA